MVKNKLTKSEVEIVKKFAKRMQIANSQYRAGQSFFNALYIMHPEIADNIRGSTVDPYYQDDKIELCIKTITDEQD